MKTKLQDFTAANLAAARVILANPVKYAGLPLEWARRVVKQIETCPNLLREELCKAWRKRRRS